MRQPDSGSAYGDRGKDAADIADVAGSRSPCGTDTNKSVGRTAALRLGRIIFRWGSTIGTSTGQRVEPGGVRPTVRRGDAPGAWWVTPGLCRSAGRGFLRSRLGSGRMGARCDASPGCLGERVVSDLQRRQDRATSAGCARVARDRLRHECGTADSCAGLLLRASVEAPGVIRCSTSN